MSESESIFQFHPERNRWLRMDDRELFSCCRHENYSATGRGGQKRNKTASAVRLTHQPTGLVATECSGRSQHTNRARALRKLRCRIAMMIRCGETPETAVDTGSGNPLYPLWIAMVVDHLTATDYDLKKSAEIMGISRSKLLKLLCRDTVLLQFINHCRADKGLGPLHPPA